MTISLFNRDDCAAVAAAWAEAYREFLSESHLRPSGKICIIAASWHIGTNRYIVNTDYLTGTGDNNDSRR